MKIHITMKTPSAVEDAIEQTGLQIENEEQREKEQHEWEKICKRYFEWGEYCVIEIDTEKNTATVLKVGA